MRKEKLHFHSKTIHGGQQPDKGYRAVMPPVYLTSTYAQSSPGDHQGYEYSRTHNPTRTALEASLASIENGTHGFCFGSGMAAIDAVVKLLSPGDEVISTNESIKDDVDKLSQPYQTAVDIMGDLIIADAKNNRIQKRKINNE